jgi:hypothetical protein
VITAAAAGTILFIVIPFRSKTAGFCFPFYHITFAALVKKSNPPSKPY